jgi:hypothetical protein
MKPSIKKIRPVPHHVDEGRMPRNNAPYRAPFTHVGCYAAPDAVSAHPYGAARDQQSRNIESRNRANLNRYAGNGADGN